MGITGEWVLPPQPVARTGTNLANLGGEFLLQGPAKRHSEGGTNMRGRIIDPGTGREVYLGGDPVYVERELRDESGTYRDYGGGSLLAKAMQRARQGNASSYQPENRIDPASLVLDEGDLGPEDLRNYDWQEKVRESLAQDMVSGGRSGAEAWIAAEKARNARLEPKAWDATGGDPAALSATRKRGDFSPEYGLIKVPYRQPNGKWTTVTIDPGATAEVATKNPDAYFTSERDEYVTAGKKAQALSNEFKTPVITGRALQNREEEGAFRSLTVEEARDPALKGAIGFLTQVSREPIEPTASMGYVNRELGTTSELGQGDYSFSRKQLVTKEVPVYQLTRRDDEEALYRLGSPYARQYDKLGPALAALANEGMGLPTGVKNLAPEEIVQEIQRRFEREQGMPPEKRRITKIPARLIEKAASQGKTIAGPHSFIRDDGTAEVRVPQVVIAAGGKLTDMPAGGNYLKVDRDFYDQLGQQPYGPGPLLPSPGFRSLQEKKVLGGGIDPNLPYEVDFTADPALAQALIDTPSGRMARAAGQWLPAEEVQSRGLVNRRPGVRGMSTSSLIEEMGPLGGVGGGMDGLGNYIYSEGGRSRGRIPVGSGAASPWPFSAMSFPEERAARRDLLLGRAGPSEIPVSPSVATPTPDYDLPTAVDMPGTDYDALDVDYDTDSTAFGTGYKTLDRPGNPLSNRLEPFVQVAAQFGVPDPAGVAEVAMRTAPVSNGQVLFDDVVQRIAEIAAPPVRSIGEDTVARNNRAVLRSAYKLPASAMPPLAEIVPDPEARRALVTLGLDRALESGDPIATDAAERLLVARQIARASNQATPPAMAASRRLSTGDTYASPALEPYFTGDGVTASRPAATPRPSRSTLETARAAYAAALAGPERQRQEWIPGLASSPAELEARPRIGDREAYEAQAAYQRQVDYWKRAGAKARSEQSLGGRYFYPNEQPLQLGLPGWSASSVDPQEPGRLRRLLQEMAIQRAS